MRAASLILVLLVAGCSGPVGPVDDSSRTTHAPTTTHPPNATAPGEQHDDRSRTTEPTSTTASGGDSTTPPEPKSESIDVTGGSLPVDADRVWRRVQRMVGTNVSPPTRIRVRRGAPSGATLALPWFYGAMTGTERVTAEPPVPGGSVRGRAGDEVRVRLPEDGEASPEAVERILAHEFVHVIQLKTDAVPPRLPEDVRVALMEGGAYYVEDAYVETHLPAIESGADALPERYHGGSPVTRLTLAPAYFGHRYVAAEVDDPENVWAAYEDPPRTTEQLLHTAKTGQEPAALRLRVNVTEPGWTNASSETTGELFVRSLLGAELNRSRAETAAAGWGNDRLVTLRNATSDRYVWALRWDDSANAAEFERAMTSFLDARGARSDDTWTVDDRAFAVRRTGEDTVVVLVGDARFVRTVSVDGGGGTVSVHVE